MKTRRVIVSLILAVSLVLALAVSASATSAASENKSADVTFTSGGGATPLKIASGAPSLTFGSHSIELSDMFYTEASNAAIEITVEDLRGTGVGWSLQAKLEDFINGTDTLPGAEITFRNATITHNFDGGSAAAAVPGGSVTLNAGASAATPMLVATPTGGGTAGMGQTITSWAVPAGTGESPTATTDPIELKVLAGTPKALQYTAVLAWDLINAP